VFARIGRPGLEIINGVDGWEAASDGINEAVVEETVPLTPQGSPARERVVTHRLICTRATRSALTAQIEKAHQICAQASRDDASAAGMALPPVILRIVRGDSSFAFARVTDARVVCERVERTGNGWVASVTLTTTLCDAWLGAVPPASGSATDNADRIVRSSIPGWRREDVTFLTQASHAAPATWVIRHPDGALSSGEMRIIVAAQRETSGGGALGAVVMRPTESTFGSGSVLWDNGVMRVYAGAVNNQTTPAFIAVDYHVAPGWNTRLLSDTVDVWLLVASVQQLAITASIELHSTLYSSTPLAYFAPNALRAYLGRFVMPVSARQMADYLVRVYLTVPASGLNYNNALVVGGLVLSNPGRSMVAASIGEAHSDMPSTAWCHGAVNDMRRSMLASGLPASATDATAYTERRVYGSELLIGDPNLVMDNQVALCVGGLATAISSQTWTIRRRAILLAGA
jgi:hypothetical protein